MNELVEGLAPPLIAASLSASRHRAESAASVGLEVGGYTTRPPTPTAADSHAYTTLSNNLAQEDEETRARRYLYVLPVLFYEYLAIALARSLLPGMMVDFFGLYTYQVIGK
jgi:hypothetical protein